MKEYTQIYNDFVRELAEWSDKGSIPESGTQDIAYYLGLKKKRLGHRNITLKYSFDNLDSSGNQHAPRAVWSSHGERYTVKLVTDDCTKKVECFRKGKRLYHDKKKSSFCQQIIYLNEGDDREDELYTCPRCGGISTVKSLINGCQYCSAKFQINELFPKVTSYYFTDSLINRRAIRMSKMCGAGLAIVATVIGVVCAQSAGIAFEMVLAGLFYAPFFSFIGYLAFSVFILVITFIRGVAASPHYINKNRTRRILTSFFIKYDSSFSYDYFTAKIIAILESIVYTDDRNNLTMCQNRMDEEAFNDIIDMAYQDIMTLNSCQVSGDYCYLDVNVYMEDLYDGMKKIYKKKDIFRIKLCKNISKPEDYSFSIKMVKCRGCGDSFDATRIRYCPCCGREYDHRDNDWVVLDISKI
ncbi:MAG: hypothetical protein ACI4D0_09680 [Lachnospira sp.]